MDQQDPTRGEIGAMDDSRHMMQVDPEFIYKVTDEDFIVAYVMVLSYAIKAEYWHMKSGWGMHRPGNAGAKTWVFTPISAKDTSFGFGIPFPDDSSETKALAGFKTLFKMETGDVMRKHLITVLP